MKNINTQFYLANYSCSNTVSNSTQQQTSSTSQKAVLPFDSIIETAELSPRKAYRFDKIVYVKDKHAFAAEYNGIYYSNWKTRDDYMKNGQPNTYALYSNEDDWYAFDSNGNFSTICHSEPEPEPVEPEPEPTYSIIFKDGNNVVRTITGVTGTDVTIPNVTKVGYSFNGWSIDGEHVVRPDTNIGNENITYIALWTKLPTYTITFMNGETIAKTVTGITGTSVSAPNVTREGYDFNGWSINGESPILPVDAITDCDITYIALWIKAKDYSIKYGQTEGSMSDFLNQFGIEDTSEISVEAEEALGELLNDMTVLQFSGSLDIEKTDDIIYIYVPNTVRFIKCIIEGYFSSPLYSQAGNNFDETIELSEGTLYIHRDPVRLSGESTLKFTFSKNNG